MISDADRRRFLLLPVTAHRTRGHIEACSLCGPLAFGNDNIVFVVSGP
jgi:hypothetical protein